MKPSFLNWVIYMLGIIVIGSYVLHKFSPEFEECSLNPNDPKSPIIKVKNCQEYHFKFRKAFPQ